MEEQASRLCDYIQKDKFNEFYNLLITTDLRYVAELCIYTAVIHNRIKMLNLLLERYYNYLSDTEIQCCLDNATLEIKSIFNNYKNINNNKFKLIS